MIRRSVIPATDDFETARGSVVCRDVSITGLTGSTTIRRGACVDEALWQKVSGDPNATLDVVIPEPGEVEQGEASWMFARSVVGPNVVVERPHQGQCILRAATSGLLRVSGTQVSRVNRRGTILLATALDGRVVTEGDTFAIVKAASLWTRSDDLRRSERIACREPILRVARFVARTAAFLAGSRIRTRNFSTAQTNLRRMLGPFGGNLALARQVSDEPDTIAREYRQAMALGADVVLVGGSIVLDPGDPFVVALEDVGARLVCRGAPVDPGTMFWVAYAGSTVFLGLASCELYGRETVFDLVLPYVMAKEDLSPALLGELGYGGLLAQTFAARRTDGPVQASGD
jgi:hypothetical protein